MYIQSQIVFIHTQNLYLNDSYFYLLVLVHIFFIGQPVAANDLLGSDVTVKAAFAGIEIDDKLSSFL